MAEGTRHVLIQRITIEKVNEQVNDHEERLRQIEIKLGIREEEVEDDE